MINYIELKCDMCSKIYKIRNTQHKVNIKRKYNNKFCSNACHAKFKHKQKSIKLNCGFCNAELIRTNAQIRQSKSGQMFCNCSCAAKYNNTHKTTGNRRSKLEIYLEEQIKLNYPDLECIYNSKETINSELDFYFPTLKFAIELNGIFHYEPIYGDDKLEKIQFNDSQKILLCAKNDIELCIIDSSSCKYLNQKQKDKYWSLINNILNKIQYRNK